MPPISMKKILIFVLIVLLLSQGDKIIDFFSKLGLW